MPSRCRTHRSCIVAASHHHALMCSYALHATRRLKRRFTASHPNALTPSVLDTAASSQHHTITSTCAHAASQRAHLLHHTPSCWAHTARQHHRGITQPRAHALKRFALALLCVTSSHAGLLTQASRRSPRSWCVCHDCGCRQHTRNALWHAEVRRDNVILRCPTHSAVRVRTFWRPVRRRQHFRRQQARSKRESKSLASTMLHRDAAWPRARRTPRAVD